MGAVQADGEAQGDGLQPPEARVVLPADGVFIGPGVQDLLHLPQVLGGWDHIVEASAGAHHPGELLRAQGGEHVGEQVRPRVRHRQMVHRGHGELPLLHPLGRPTQGKLGDVHPGQLGGAARLGQGLGQPLGVVALPAAAVQQGGGGQVRRVPQGQGAQRLPEGRIVPLLQKGGPGGHHGLVVPRVLGVLPVGGEQVDIAGGGAVKAVPAWAGVGALPPSQRGGAQRTAEKTHGAFTSNGRMGLPGRTGPGQ